MAFINEILKQFWLKVAIDWKILESRNQNLKPLSKVYANRLTNNVVIEVGNPDDQCTHNRPLCVKSLGGLISKSF